MSTDIRSRREINLEPIEPVFGGWTEFQSPPEVSESFCGFPTRCFWHEATDMTVISTLQPNEVNDQLQHRLHISRKATRQASDREITLVLTQFKATDFVPLQRQGAIRVFAKTLNTDGKPIQVRLTSADNQ